ncbi:DUF1214 domain-containing protein [Lentisphaera profundi]|uniref:DUF1214 domain-containing protein n=1 Tax=Lentisphaera profundi TaxID=1658616 RepID=A0ABY7VSU9_9BACT|nr:DUF1214 domain-containing protein [Lentisphaera profundi]WDE96389.1 DUF1214 domain-containing protein [Lentisphaera profundi]
MKKFSLIPLALIGMIFSSCSSSKPSVFDDMCTTEVSVKNFVRAETDMQMKGYVHAFNAFGQLHHNRAMYDVTKQITIRPNTDTLYSFGIYDLTTPVKLSMPKLDRYQSAMIVNQDHSLFAAYEGDHDFTQDKIGTRYVFIVIRTFVDPNDEADLENAHKAQDMIKISQKSRGRFSITRWDVKSLEAKRQQLAEIAGLLSGTQGMFGKKEDLNPVIHLVGTAYGWGGLPEKDAFYNLGEVENNDGKALYSLTVKDVPVDGFWSVTVYNQKGYFDINERGVYSINSKTAKRNEDGSVTVNFGGDSSQANVLDIMPGWNYAIRLYKPQQSILDGTWNFPKPSELK